MKTQIFEEKATFLAIEFSQPSFSRLIEYENLNDHFISVHKVVWQLLCKLEDNFLGTYEVDENNFSREGYFPYEKKISVLNNLLGVTEMILYRAQGSPKIFV